MPEGRLGPARWALIVGLSVLTLGVGLGRAGRLTYHEAFVAQAAREMTARGDALVPTIGGRPWLEKPPLSVWLVALAGRVSGGIGEGVARLPSAAAGLLLVVGVTLFAGRRFGPGPGLLAGLIQATTAWTVMRGRLAEVDILLACLITWAIVAFDRMRGAGPIAPGITPPGAPFARGGEERTPPRLSSPPCEGGQAKQPGRLGAWRWVFFAMLGLSGLAKGVGFGAVLIGSVVALTLAWDRDGAAWRRLRFAPGWLLAAALGLTWPVLVALRHPSALGLWALHVTDRLAARPEHFIGTPWWQFVPIVLGQVLPWTPLAAAGACRSLARALRGRGEGDRLLWAWSAAPLLLLSLATVKSPHYAIHALPPCSVWAALALARLGERRRRRGWSPGRLRRRAWAAFAGLGLAIALGYAVFGPRLDRRGVEWAFYERAGRLLRAGEPLALLYNVPDWDREPYPSPFGPVPHDLAVRLFYLDRPACWRFGAEALTREPPASGAPFAVIGRDCDLPALGRLGRVETLAQGPSTRRDRTYRLFRVTPGTEAQAAPREPRLTQIGGRWEE